MTAKLLTYLPSGALQMDSSRVTFGLRKSGNLVFAYRDYKLIQRSIGGDVWIPWTQYDDVYSCTFEAVAPVLFLHGPGARAYMTRNGNQWTFYFAGASVETRFYMFDFMIDTGTGPALITRTPEGAVTFNSRQWPMNVVANVVPAVPPPPIGNPTPPWGRNYPAYTGGTFEVLAAQSSTFEWIVSRWHYQMTPGRLYAASLQWSRGAMMVGGEYTYNRAWNVIEGAYGNVGSMSFWFTTLPGTKFGYEYVTERFYNVPTRLPAAQVIDVTDLPFPYDA
ncbi:hypothetical protein PSm6_44780 [Pseudomonas solani]|uniref:Uncharacterized protein n=1 Tax=Pseudomonas solani TaxID=2731552 RepID=A0ABM7LES3_9PSED|nr:hypothetical protein [Pseudomonas solani]BCD88071.1 hypothetical protein PSm6_44780 [Pseudomonas solani]